MTAFTEPPYDEDPEASRASFFDRVARYSRAKPDFRLMLAWNQAEVLGLALGAGAPSGDWWRENIIAQLTPDDAEEWFDEKRAGMYSDRGRGPYWRISRALCVRDASE